MKAILITGSRDWADPKAVQLAIEDSEAHLVIHGAARGADSFAGDTCRWFKYPSDLPMPAQWTRDGKEAGPMRNKRMLEVLLALQACGWDVEVHAFPLPRSRGTRHMMSLAKRAGVVVVVHSHMRGEEWCRYE